MFKFLLSNLQIRNKKLLQRRFSISQKHISAARNLSKKVMWIEYFVTKYNLKTKSIIRGLQKSSCRKDSLICLIYWDKCEWIDDIFIFLYVLGISNTLILTIKL